MFASKMHDANTFEFLVLPNRSATWREVQWFFLLCVAVAIGIAVFFCMHGYWLVVPFSGLEISALGAVLYLCARKTHRAEMIRINPKGVQISRNWEPRRVRHFQTHWVQARMQPGAHPWYGSSLLLGSHGTYLEIGAFLNEADRQGLKDELTRCIAAARLSGATMQETSRSYLTAWHVEGELDAVHG